MTRSIAGETAEFEIVVWNTGPGTALDVTLDDDLPGADIEWFEVDDPSDPATTLVNNALHCDFGDLGVTTMEDSPARVTVAAETDRDDCGVLDNEAFADASNQDQIFADGLDPRPLPARRDRQDQRPAGPGPAGDGGQLHPE